MTTTSDIKNTEKYTDPVNGTLTVRYSYDITNSSWEDFSIFSGKSSITSQSLFSSALSIWEQYLPNIQFEENNTNPSIVFFKTNFVDASALGATNTSIIGDEIQGSEIAIKSSLDASTNQAFENVLHELGHALGLSDIAENVSNQYNTDITLMSYNVPNGRYAVTPMALDVLALEEKYGAAIHNDENGNVYSTAAGDFDGSKRSQTIVDTGGSDDEFNFSSYTLGGVNVDLRQAIESNGNWTGYHTKVGEEYIYIAHNTIIENATGTNDADSLIGNSLGNILTGNGGADTLSGFLGNDILHGGAGNDTLIGGHGADTLNGGDGDDVYVFNFDDGADNGSNSPDVITDTGGNDVIRFGIGVHRINWQQIGDDLQIQYGGDNAHTPNYITLKDFFLTDPDLRIESYELYDGYTRSITDTFFPGPPPPTQPFGVQIIGTHASETITGTNDRDVLSGGNGNNTIYGEGGDDNISAGAHEDMIYGGDGNDNISSGRGDDVIYGGNGNDILSGYYGADIIYGEAGDDYLVADSWGDQTEANELYGGDGNDRLEANGHGSLLYGGAGDDDISGSGNGTILDGGTGHDILRYSAPNAEIDLALETITRIDVSETITVRNFEQVEFGGNSGTSSMTVRGTDTREIFRASAGSSTVHGRGGDDLIQAIRGNNSLRGDAGNDVIIGGNGIDHIDGGDDFDTVEYQDIDYNGNVVINLETGIVDNDGWGNIETVLNVEAVITSFRNDTVTGSPDDEKIYTSGGDDMIYGSGGKDYIHGGDGHNDTVDYSSFSQGITIDRANNRIDKDGDGTYDDTLISVENIIGSSHGDTLQGSSGNDVFTIGGLGNDYYYGHAGDDALHGGDGDDFLSGGDGTDYLYGENGNDTLYGGNGTDYLHGGDGDEFLSGGDGTDYLYGENGNDTLHGGNGTDYLYGGEGQDTFDGGDGQDFLSYDGLSTGIQMWDASSIDKNSDGIVDDTFTNIEWIAGTEHQDVFLGSSQFNRTFSGGLEYDTVLYYSLNQGITLTYSSDYNPITIDKDGDGVADDSLYGIEFIAGTSHGDTHNGSSIGDGINGADGDDTIYGNAGNDFIVGGAGNDYIDGGDGHDTADYYYASSGVVVNLLATDWEYAPGQIIAAKTALDGDGGTDTLYNIEEIYGSQFDDYINGANGVAGTIYGEAGNDVIIGGDGNDTIYGGDGDDLITALGGNDIVYGDAGVDTISGSGSDDTLYGGSGNDIVRGQAGQDLIYGDDGDDELRGYQDNDTLYGGAGNDTIYGGQTINDTYASDDVLYGDDGDDALWGLKGNDELRGGAGNDVLFGGEGNDILYTSDDRDVMRGEGGADTFKFTDNTTVDIIKDFNIGEGDILDLSDILDYTKGVDDITDFVQITDSGDNSLVLVDADGTGTNSSWTWVATLHNITGITDVATLETNNNLIG